MSVTGKVVAAYGFMLTASFEGSVRQNELAYIHVADGAKLKSEVIRVRGSLCYVQVFELTSGVKVGDLVEFTGDLLVVELGPGLLKQVYDGLQNPLPELAEKAGLFLKRGIYMDSLDRKSLWEFTPTAKEGDRITSGDILGWVPEGKFEHQIFVPFNFIGEAVIKKIAAKGRYTVLDTIAEVEGDDGQTHRAHHDAGVAHQDPAQAIRGATSPRWSPW